MANSNISFVGEENKCIFLQNILKVYLGNITVMHNTSYIEYSLHVHRKHSQRLLFDLVIIKQK